MVKWWTSAGVAALLFMASALACASPGVFATVDFPFVHRAWGADAGAPPYIHSIAQDKDGYLMLGTGMGLVRFDGEHFDPVRLADGSTLSSGDITALHYARNGDLWIGYLHGGIARLRGDVLTRWDIGPINHDGWVSALAQTPDGTLWAAGRGGLFRFSGQAWERMGVTEGYPDASSGDAMVSADGVLWVTDAHVLRYLKPGQQHFGATNIRVRPNTQLARSGKGTLWIGNMSMGLRALPGVTADHPTGRDSLPPVDIHAISMQRMVVDAEGNLWGTPEPSGTLLVILHADRHADGHLINTTDVTASITAAEGLTANHTLPVFEDREGTVWVGTSAGLDSFRRSPVRRIMCLPEVEGNAAYLRPGAGDGAWLATLRGIYTLGSDDRLEPLARPVQQPDLLAMATHGPDGSLWAIFERNILRVGLRDTVAVAPPPLPRNSWYGLAYIQPDDRGGAYFSVVGKSVWHVAGDQWSTVACMTAGTPQWMALAEGRDGVFWAGGLDGKVVRYDEQAARCRVWRTHGIGEIWAIDASEASVLVAGQQGVARVSAAGVAEVNHLGADAIRGVTGVARAGGYVWLNTATGLFRVHPDDLERAMDGDGTVPRHRIFTALDGVPGIARPDDINTLAVDHRGRLLIEGEDGTGILDTADVHANGVPPAVFIRQVTTESGAYVPSPPSQSLRLPAGSSHIRIGYTATSFAAPTGLTFRYRMEGVDDTWQEAGVRREAFYTNLGPGTYRFDVVATNEDGIASRAPASVVITIAPAYYEAWWFRLALAFVMLAGVTALARNRLRRVREEARLQMEAAASERMRIARELHDTLLQSVQGLTMMMSAAKGHLAEEHPAYHSLTHAVRFGHAAVEEGRTALLDLRGGIVHDSTLDVAIGAIGADLQHVYATPFQVVVRRAVPVYAADDTLQLTNIVREALNNAFRHAKASRIRCDINARPLLLRIRIVDDGIGLAGTSVQSAAGHFGIRGMHERARRVGASVSVRSTPGQGTVVALVWRPGQKRLWRWLRR